MAHTHICDLIHSIDIRRDSITSNLFGRCIPIGNVIRMPRWYSHTDVLKQESLIVHNIVHLEQQKFSPLYALFVWISKYIFSKKFRAVCEMEAFWAQLEHLVYCREVEVRYHIIESRMCDMYGDAINIRLAKAFTCAFKSGEKPHDWYDFYKKYMCST